MKIRITLLPPEVNNDNINNDKLVKTGPPTLIEEIVKNQVFRCSFLEVRDLLKWKNMSKEIQITNKLGSASKEPT